MCLSPRPIRDSPQSITWRTSRSSASASRDHAFGGLAVTKLVRRQCALMRSNLANHEAFYRSNLVLEETIEGRRNTTIDDKLAQFGFSIKGERECSAPPEVAAGNLQNVFREILMQLAVTSPARPRISRGAPSRVARRSLGRKPMPAKTTIASLVLASAISSALATIAFA